MYIWRLVAKAIMATVIPMIILTNTVTHTNIPMSTVMEAMMAMDTVATLRRFQK